MGGVHMGPRDTRSVLPADHAEYAVVGRTAEDADREWGIEI